MLAKLECLKKKLYFLKYNMLFNKALSEGKITRFDDEIFDKMNGTIIACLPVSFYIKYSNYLFAKGTCYERSLYMFLALDDALLVRGNNKVLEYNYGKEDEGHGWVEFGNYVYDPSLMLKFDKDIYYKLYGCSKVYKIDKNTYLQQHNNFARVHVSHDYDDFKPNGKKRLDLNIIIIQIRSLCKMLGDEQFTKDFYDYLALIEYDEKHFLEENEKNIQRVLINGLSG